MQGGRAIDVEPAAMAELARPPQGLCELGRMVWARAVETLGPKRHLAPGDLPALEMMCHEWAAWRRLVDDMAATDGGEFSITPNGHRVLSPEGIAASRHQKQFLALAGQFGLTPVARVKTAGTAQFALPLGEPSAEIDPCDPFAGRPN